MTSLFSSRTALVRRTRTQLSIAVAAATMAMGATPVSAQDESSEKGYVLVLEEVVVTAQKRAETTMTVPIAVDAFSAQDIVNTGATDIGDIDNFMPGVL